MTDRPPCERAALPAGTPATFDAAFQPPEPQAAWRLSFHRGDGSAWQARVHGPGGYCVDFCSPFELARWCMTQVQQDSADARRRAGHSSLR